MLFDMWEHRLIEFVVLHGFCNPKEFNERRLSKPESRLLLSYLKCLDVNRKCRVISTSIDSRSIHSLSVIWNIKEAGLELTLAFVARVCIAPKGNRREDQLHGR